MAKTSLSSRIDLWSDENNLIEVLRRGDDAAWRYVYKITWPLISGYVMAQGGSEDDAKEAHQLAMTVLYEKRYTLTASIKTYTFAVAKYTWWQINKKRGKMIPYEPDPLYNGNEDDENDPLDNLGVIGPDGVENPYDSSELPSVDEVLDYIKTIDNPCRDLLLDHYIGQIKYEEIADETNQKSGTIRQQANRCLEKVKQYFLNRNNNQ